MVGNGRESSLRAHIHNLLYDYALSHLTTDYVVFGHQAVSEVLSECLYTIPANDPASIALEPTLQELISDGLQLSKLPGYQERLGVDQDAKLCLQGFFKSILSGLKGRSRADQSWLEDEEEDIMFQSMSPVLTIRAIRQTPKLRGRLASELIPGPAASLLRSHSIKEVDTTSLDLELSRKEQPDKNTSEYLGHKLVIDPEALSAVVKLIHQVRHKNGVDKDNDNAYVHSFLSGDAADSPLQVVPQLASPPLFPRDRKPGGSMSTTLDATQEPGLRDLKELGSVLLPGNVNSDGSDDLYKDHMTIVNGWETYRIPSSPTPSLSSSSSDQNERIDELDLDQYLPSSPDISAKFEEKFLFAKMDEHVMPRSERIGGMESKAQTAGDDQSLQSFLSFLQPIPKTPQKYGFHDGTESYVADVKVVTTPYSRPLSPHTTIAASMLGQPPTSDSATGIANTHSDDWSSDDLGLNKILRGMYRREGTSAFAVDPRDFILKERLDDRESYLMDVPELPPPTEHPLSAQYMPKTLRALLCQKDSTDNKATQKLEDTTPSETPQVSDDIGFLQQLKGLKSLNIELTWRPFNFGTSVPTHEEVSELTENIKAECLQDLKQTYIDQPQEWAPVEDRLSRLLGEFFLSEVSEGDSSEAASGKVWLEDELGPQCPPLCAEGLEEVVLTTKDRRRIAGLPDTLPADMDLDSATSDGRGSPTRDERPVKRIRFSSPEFFEYTPAPSFELEQPDIESDSGALYMDDAFEDVEDSGIFIPNSLHTEWRPHVRHFGQLAKEARGFEGPREDGEVIPDVEPLLLEDWQPLSLVAILPPPPLAHGSVRHLHAPPNSGGMDEAIYSVDNGSEVLLPAFDATKVTATYGILGQGNLHDQGRPTTPDNDQVPHHETVPSKQRPRTELPVDKTDISHSHEQSARQQLYEFMRLRSQKVLPSSGAVSHDLISPTLPSIESSELPPEVPLELINNYTLIIPSARHRPATVHRYLASLDLIQRRGLVKALSSPQCAVQLIEREWLGGADIVLDPDAAVVFTPLRALPTQCKALTAAINQLSWRFSHLLVVFESFPWTGSQNRAEDHIEVLTVNPFSPPVVKAVKKLRRDIGVAEACYDKRIETAVHFAFPLTLKDAAGTIRQYGDLAQQRSTTSDILWDDRRWLDADDEDLDERDLAAIDGMNVFAAAVILCNISLDDFLDKSPDERVKEFGGLIGRYRMDCFNTIIARRREAMELPSSSPPLTGNTTSKSATPIEPGLAEPLRT